MCPKSGRTSSRPAESLLPPIAIIAGFARSGEKETIGARGSRHNCPVSFGATKNPGPGVSDHPAKFPEDLPEDLVEEKGTLGGAAGMVTAVEGEPVVGLGSDASGMTSRAEEVLGHPAPDAPAFSAPHPVRRARRLSWISSAAAAIMVAGLFASIAYGVIVGGVGMPNSGTHPWVTAVLALALIASGAAVAGRLPSNPLGWLLLGIALATTLDTVSWIFAAHWHVAGWAGEALWLPAISLVVPVVLLFPTGRLPSWHWRPALWASVAGTTVATIGLVVIPILVPSWLNHPLVPLHGSAAGWLKVTLLGAGMCLVAACCAAASVVGRWRSSSDLERQQLMWLGPAAMVAILSLAAEKVLPGAGYLGLALIPVALAVAVLRFGLYDLYLYLNRTLVYGALTLALVPFYVLVAALAVAVFGHDDRVVPSLVATGAVAAVFQPARYWLQRGVDRMVYGERGDPFRVVATLGHTLGDFGNPQEVLARVVETISCALQLPFASVDVMSVNGTLAVAGYGRRVASPVNFPMVHQGANVGSLLVATRAPLQQFGTAERRLLETLADQIGPVAKSVALTNELRRSRERLVRSREEERRRLRRDLHDGLGPILSGLRLGIEGAARGLPPASPLLEALGHLGEQAEAGRDEVRRLIDDLRPGVLDSLGIIGAIEDATTRFSATQADGRRIRFEVVARDLPPDLPAAVEVAAYWIVNEAIHNVVRHANADRCTVSLAASDKALEVLVVDDGDGIGSADRAGVGLASMRERAEEIGGVCWIENRTQRGTRVAAYLPVGQA